MGPDTASLLASVLIGLAAAGVVRGLIRAAAPAARPGAAGHTFDETRRGRLRAASAVYRVAGGIVDRLAGWNAAHMSGGRREKLAADLKASGLAAPWLPEEYVAAQQVQAAAVGAAAGGLAAAAAGSVLTGVLLGAMFAFVVYQVAGRDAAAKAARRRSDLLDRFPFVLDLIALMMESGASFQDSLGAAVVETEGHPLGDELREILRDVRFNRSRRDALLGFEARVGDPRVSELVFAVVKGEELGTPLGRAIRQQADQMRLRRSQWLEKEAGEAQVGIVFPGFVIMVACVLIVTAPFVIRAMTEGGGVF